MNFSLRSICPLTTADALRRAAALAPDVEALVAPDGRITYAELEQRVNRLMPALARLGVRRGDHVALCMGNSTRWVETFLALGALGAVTVPVNTRWVGDEVAYAVRQSRSKFLFINDRVLNVDFIRLLREICPAVDAGLPDPGFPDLQRIVVSGATVPAGAIAWDDFIAGPVMPIEPQCDEHDALLMQYTSGTTSFPKGVMLSHRSVLADGYCAGGRVGFRIADRYHSARPFFHVSGSTLSVIASLQHMVTLVTMEKFEPRGALDLLERERCTHFSGNDTMVLMLLGQPDLKQRRLHLRGGWVAAAPTIIRRAIDELGMREVVVAYGLSEAAPNVSLSCWWEPEDVRVSARMRVEPGIEVRILDRETGVACAPGVAGEIQVRGWSVMQGYFDKPDETAAALSADGWLSTGDLGMLDEDGRLEFIGRTKDIIRVGGENVAPFDVENVLHKHPAVKQAQVVGVPDARLVEVPAAFIIPMEGAAATLDEIQAWCRTAMASFKVPRHLMFVDSFESVGMTASSKVQKRLLAAHARKVFNLE
jgi:fatty-acyl-CoA synthase